jgi:hypothetical protein
MTFLSVEHSQHRGIDYSVETTGGSLEIWRAILEDEDTRSGSRPTPKYD